MLNITASASDIIELLPFALAETTKPTAKTGRAFPEPEDKDSLGFLLYVILGGENINPAEAAKRLDIPPYYLAHIIYGRRNVSAQYIIKKHWRENLAKYYPEGWRQHELEFEKHASAPLKRKPLKTREPENKDSFGYVLWTILGGENANVKEAAKLLNIPSASLSAILHGRKSVSKQLLIDKKWREKLAEKFPDAWQIYRSDFERYADGFITQSPYKTSEPDDKKSFGYTLWSILGGKNANINEAAERLGVSAPVLSDIIHGRMRPSKKFLIDKKWRKILAETYPDAWRQNQSRFERCARELVKQPKNITSEPKDKHSLGHTLWLILGGKDANINEAAQLLGIDRTNLSGLIHGRYKVSARYIIEKKWCERLAENYPDAWRQHERKFRKRGGLPDKRQASRFFEPEDSGSLGYTLWLIIGGKDANIVEAAKRLNMASSSLGALIHNRREVVSKKFIAEKRWAEILAEYYPDAWLQHRAEFEKRPCFIITGSSSLIREPKDKDSFGYVLWNVLGGKYAKLSKSVEELHVPRAFLIAVINNQQQVSLQFLIEKHWPEILAESFSCTWWMHEADFKKYANGLAKQVKVNELKFMEPLREPLDKNGFGIVLWRILGGENCDKDIAAELLKIDPLYLDAVVQGRLYVSQGLLLEKQWRETFAKHYSVAWEQNKSDFEQCASLLEESLPWGYSKRPAQYMVKQTARICAAG